MKIKLSKGLTLDLAGGVADRAVTEVRGSLYAVVPDDYEGFTPKLEVKEGDRVLCGSPLLHDKNDERIKIVSPVAGTVVSVVRGERRKIERVVVKADGTSEALRLDTSMPVRELLCASGMLVRMRRRPYDIVPRPDESPRDIFVTAIDDAPLAAGFSLPSDASEMLAAGAKALSSLTEGKVYVSVAPGSPYGGIAGAETVEVTGPYPAGNAGVQAANIAPVSKGEAVWTLDIATLYKIGVLTTGGSVDTHTVVAVTGSELTAPYLASCAEGIEIKALLEGRVKDTPSHKRIISGNVLTGTKVGPDAFLRFPFRQVTVIPEGDDVDEFMGWASLSPRKMSESRTFPGHFFGRAFAPDARLHGGRRAMIMSGQYDKALPMDIMLEYLVKAILGGDIEAMEDLGIYEIAPEDVAAAEYVDTSKLPLQRIIRQGLDTIRKELE